MDIRKFFAKGSGGKSNENAAGTKRPSAADKDDDDFEPVTKKSKQAVASAEQEKPKSGAAASGAKGSSGKGSKGSIAKPEITKTFTPKGQKPAAAAARPPPPPPPAETPAAVAPAAAAAAAAKKSSSGKAAGKKRTIVVDSDSEFEEEEEDDGDDDDDSDVEMLDDDDEEEVVAVERTTKRGKVSTETPSAKQQPTAAKAAASPATSPTPARKLPGILNKPAKSPPPSAAAAPTPKPAATTAKKPPAPRSGAVKSALPELPGDALAAIAAVDEAIKQLPGVSEMNVSQGSEFQQGNDNTPPPNHGNKDAPRGHPDCFTGKTFVITGVLDSLYRHEAEDFIKRHGGKVTKSVSGKTTFLVAGTNCGKSKMELAKTKGTKIIDEDHLFKLVEATSHLVKSPTTFQPTAPTPSQVANGSGPASGSGSAPSAALTAMQTSKPSGSGQAAKPSADAAAGRSSGVASTSAAPPAPLPKGAGTNEQLWVDKYKPSNSLDLVGNNTLVATLRQWLQRWEAVNLRQEEVQQGKSKSKDMSKKAVLLSGPPGIGKTSSAMIIARECGFDAVEVNASDTRSKHDSKVKEGMNGKLSNVVAEMVTSRCITLADGKQRRQVLIMDEVDGMSGGDRGGVTDLIESIKKTKIPIICICNDKYNMKLRSVRNHCMELDYRRPTTQQINRRMMEIAHKEGLTVNESTMSALVESANGDLRLILGQLQMIRLRTASLSYDDVKGKMGAAKDADMSPFECARRLLDPSSSRLSIADRLELVFMDMDLVPLLVQENYINHRPAIANNDSERLRCIAKAADAISLGDTANRLIRSGANWSLAPFANTVGTVMPGAYMRGGRETFNAYEQNFTRFTAWLGNYSSSTKQKRLLGELSTLTLSSGHIQTSRSSVRLEYASAFRHLLTAPLKNADSKDEAAIGSVVSIMKDYCINKELMEYILDVTSFKSQAAWNSDPMKDIPATTKSALTRTFNQQGVKARCGLMVEDVKKGKGKKAAAPATDELLGNETGEAGELAPIPEAEEEEEEVVDAAALKKEGIELVTKDTGKGGRGRGRSGKGSGRGSGRASGSGARGSGAARGSGRGASGRGRGSGRGK